MCHSPKAKVLIVEDSRLQAQIAAEALSAHGYAAEIALSPEEALRAVLKPNSPDLILMDIDLGNGRDGTALASSLLKQKDVPVVFLTALSTPEIMARVRAVTRYGYVLKGAPALVLVSAVEMALELHKAISSAEVFRKIVEDSLTEVYLFHPESLKFLAVNRGARENLGYSEEELRNMTPLDLKPEFNVQSFRALLAPLVQGEKERLVFETVHRRKDGSLYPVEVHLQLFRHGKDKVCAAFILDLSERKRMEKELYRMSVTDPLTGLYNRRYFMEMLEKEIARLRRTNRPFCVIMLDLDHFKNINDRFGHAAGDRVLKKTAALFRKRLRKTDCLARWGGEEFVILLPETTLQGGATLAEELRQKLSGTAFPGVDRVTASFGVTQSQPSDNADLIIQRVDAALYRAKGKGRNRVETG